MAKMNIQEYKDRVIAQFKGIQIPTKGILQNPDSQPKATEEDWKLLGRLFLNASENGEDGMENFDKRILSTQEFKKLYELEEFQDYIDQPSGYPFFPENEATEEEK